MNVLDGMREKMEIHTVDGVHWKRGESLCLCLFFYLFLFSSFSGFDACHFFEFLPVFPISPCSSLLFPLKTSLEKVVL